LCDALGACTELDAVYRRRLKMALEELRLIDEQIGELDKEMASLLSQHQDAVGAWLGQSTPQRDQFFSQLTFCGRGRRRPLPRIPGFLGGREENSKNYNCAHRKLSHQRVQRVQRTQLRLQRAFVLG
jgi:hypothetical protein